jgi:hypothetical protein
VVELMASVVSVAARERAQRERLRDLALLEPAGGDPARTSPSRAVKVSHTFSSFPPFKLFPRLYSPLDGCDASAVVLSVCACVVHPMRRGLALWLWLAWFFHISMW